MDKLTIASYEPGVYCAVDLVETMEIRFHPVLFEVKDIGMAGFGCYLMLKAHQPIVENMAISLLAIKQFASGYITAMKGISS